MSTSNKKINVLMVNYEFPPIGGGGGTTTRFVAKYMARLGLNVTVVTAKPGPVDAIEHPDGFKINYVGPTKNKLSGTHIPELARYALTLIYYSKNIVKTIKPDILHCFFTLPSGSFGLYCKKIYGIPYVVSTLGADVPGFNIGDWRLDVYHRLTKFISRSIWNNASAIVANSNSLRETCLQFDSKHDIGVITNGVDTELFYPNPNKTYSHEIVQLLFISRLMPQKGVDTLIKACGILKQRGVNNYRLTIVGDGHLKDLMYSLIDKYEIRDKINHIGWRDLEDLPPIYRSADIFILPSVMEGMSSVTLQAMASGLPIVASRVKGFEDILEENGNGLTAEYKDAEGFANAVEKLIKSPELREKMSKSSLEKSKQFSWETITKQYLGLYEKALSKKLSQKEEALV
ncbi:MAG: glycosyltransferase family 4 protein [Candidatus Melainabacteria bacterium]|nr:glycosyltransferase family 4 protein [Candidatus Melainabacteria bacterium]MBI3309277.1 glycosyltransferase family 4 protein [Candidatus Melainabacteria bacterium]